MIRTQDKEGWSIQYYMGSPQYRSAANKITNLQPKYILLNKQNKHKFSTFASKLDANAHRFLLNGIYFGRECTILYLQIKTITGTILSPVSFSGTKHSPARNLLPLCLLTECIQFKNDNSNVHKLFQEYLS